MTFFTQTTFRMRLKTEVWIAISPKGMTEPFFRESGLAIN
jgi:hypothetical protein